MYARLAEITSLDGSIAVTLAAHQAIGLKVKINYSCRAVHEASLSDVCYLDRREMSPPD